MIAGLLEPQPVGASSDPLDADGVGMGRERPEVLDVAGEHDAARFRTGNDDGVHRGAALGKVAQFARATSKGGRQVLPNVASLEQTIHRRIIATAARGRLGDDHGRNQRWPGANANQRADVRCSRGRPSRFAHLHLRSYGIELRNDALKMCTPV